MSRVFGGSEGNKQRGARMQARHQDNAGSSHQLQ